MKRQLVCALIYLATLSSAFAAEDVQPAPGSSDASTPVEESAAPIEVQKKPLHFVLGAGLTFGGDKLATVVYTDGSSDSINAGDGLLFHAGLDYRIDEAFSFQGTLGFHMDVTKPAKNGDVAFTRIPLDLLAYYNINDAFRIGGGARIVSSPKLEGSGDAVNIQESFASTMGLVIEGEYMVGSTVGIKLRHVSESYKPTGSPVSIDGSHFGVLVNFYL